MSNQLKRLIEKIVDIMKEEGIKFLTIRSEDKWNAEERRMYPSNDYTVDMGWYKTRETIEKED